MSLALERDKSDNLQTHRLDRSILAILPLERQVSNQASQTPQILQTPGNYLNPGEISEILQRNALTREAYARVLSRVNTLEERKSGLEKLANAGFIPELLELIEVNKNHPPEIYQQSFREVLNNYMELSARIIFQDPETLNHVVRMITKTDESSTSWLRKNFDPNLRKEWDALYDAFQFFADTITSPPYDLDSHETNNFITIFLSLTRIIGIHNISSYALSFDILTGREKEAKIIYPLGGELEGIKAVGRLSSKKQEPEFKFFKGKGPKGNHDSKLEELDSKLRGLNLDEYLRDPNGEIELRKTLSERGISPYCLSQYQGFELQLREGRIIGAQIGSKIDGVHNLFYERKKDLAMVPTYETVARLIQGFMRSINPALFDESFQGVTLRMNPRTGHYPIAREGTRILSSEELTQKIQIGSVNALSKMRLDPLYQKLPYVTLVASYSRKEAA